MIFCLPLAMVASYSGRSLRAFIYIFSRLQQARGRREGPLIHDSACAKYCIPHWRAVRLFAVVSNYRRPRRKPLLLPHAIARLRLKLPHSEYSFIFISRREQLARFISRISWPLIVLMRSHRRALFFITLYILTGMAIARARLRHYLYTHIAVRL